MQTWEQAVFVSYAWGDQREEIIHQIDKALQTRGNAILRHTRELIYRGSISPRLARMG